MFELEHQCADALEKAEAALAAMHAQPDGWVSEQDAKIKRLSEALRDFEDAAYGRGTEDLRELHAEALRDAGVKPCDAMKIPEES
jgi:uncharacterized protein YjiS (DUF1127 family)